jgi:HSP20 family protein
MREQQGTKPGATSTEAPQPSSISPRETGRNVSRRESSTWQQHDPFTTLRRLADQMDRWAFGTGFDWPRSSFFGGRLRGSTEWMPQIESFQRGDEFIVRADLPGIEKKDITVEVEDNALVIQGERSETRDQREEGYYSSERSYGRFSRVVPIPEGAIADSVRASYTNGVLEIVMKAPPREVSRGRKVEISDESGARR